MPTFAETLATYEKVWNERDSSKRAQLLQECAAANLRYIERDAEYSGRDAFVNYLASLEETALSRKYSAAAVHHGHAWTSWQVVTGDDSTVRGGAEFVEFSVDGLLNKVVAFDSQEGGNRSIGERLYNWAMENPLPAAGVLGGALYLILRIPLSLFYGKLGITPEEAGFDNVTVLLQSALAIGTVFAGLIAFVLLWGPSWSSFRVASRLNAELQEPASKQQLVIAGVYGPIFVVMIYTSVLTFRWAIFWLVVVFAIWPPIFLMLLYRGSKAPARRRQMKKLIRGLPVGVAANVLLLELILVLFVGPIVAYTDANNVRNGSQYSDLFRPWKALPVEVSWTTKEKKEHAPRLPACSDLRLLGSTDKQIVLLNWKSGEVYRFPPNDLVVSVKRRC
jgi:hypothetical protein